MNQDDYQQVRRWMYRNARPLDLARWRYHLEGGSQYDVLTMLSAYQNPDGGFGHALEADSWNPNTSPIQTWAATEIIHELAAVPSQNQIIQGILAWMDNTTCFDGRIWSNSVPTNNDYPHAPWWGYSPDTVPATGVTAADYNPTAALAGFGLLYAARGSSLWVQCQQVAGAAIDTLLSSEPLDDMHAGACYVRLLDYIESASLADLFLTEEFRHSLSTMVDRQVNKDVKTWPGAYVCKPSQFLNHPDSPYYPMLKAVVNDECEFIEKTLPKEGVWDVNWQWNDYPAEWAISQLWWRGCIAVNNTLYLRNFGRLQQQRA